MVTQLAPQVSEQDIQHLREWISKTPYVPTHYDDHFLRSFIIGCKGSLQKTKLVLDKFSSVVTKYPHMYGNLDMRRKAISDFLDSMYCFPLHRKIDQDVSVFFYRLPDGVQDPYKYDVYAYFAIELASTLIRIKGDQLGSGRMMLIVDGQGVQLAHIRAITPSLVKTWLEILGNVLPLRLYAIHTINMPVFVEWIFNLIKQLIKAKIAQRVHLHSSLESLLKHVPREILPRDYGGLDLESKALADEWRKKLEDSTEMLLEEESLLKEADKLRPKSKDDEDMVGTFKQLTVD